MNIVSSVKKNMVEKFTLTKYSLKTKKLVFGTNESVMHFLQNDLKIGKLKLRIISKTGDNKMTLDIILFWITYITIFTAIGMITSSVTAQL